MHEGGRKEKTVSDRKGEKLREKETQNRGREKKGKKLVKNQEAKKKTKPGEAGGAQKQREDE